MVTPKVTEPTSGDPPEPPKTFTQDEVNAMMGRVRIEERGKFPDYDKLKARAKVADDLEKATLTEREKADQKAAEWQRRALDADGRIADTAIRAEIRVQAALLGVIDPDAAVALLDRSGVSYKDEDGVMGVKEALTALLETKPYLKGQAGKPVAANLNPKGGKPAESPTPLTAQQQNVAHRLFPDLSHADAEIRYGKGLETKRS